MSVEKNEHQERVGSHQSEKREAKTGRPRARKAEPFETIVLSRSVAARRRVGELIGTRVYPVLHPVHIPLDQIKLVAMLCDQLEHAIKQLADARQLRFDTAQLFWTIHRNCCRLCLPPLVALLQEHLFDEAKMQALLIVAVLSAAHRVQCKLDGTLGRKLGLGTAIGHDFECQAHSGESTRLLRVARQRRRLARACSELPKLGRAIFGPHAPRLAIEKKQTKLDSRTPTMSGWLSVLLLLVVGMAHATPPSCAILFCGTGDACAESFANVWLAAAQDEAVRVYHTLNGGYVKGGCTVAPADPDRLIAPLPVPTDTLICIDANSAPTDCAFKKCKYADHPELFEDDPCKEGEKKPEKHKRGDLDKSACRPLSSWLAIAIQKLSRALDLAEAGQFDEAASYACVAEYLFAQLALRIDHLFEDSKLTFLNAFARQNHRYRHVIGGSQTALFEGEFGVTVRAVQSLRSCGLEPAPGVSSVLVYSRFDDDQAQVEPTTQLLWTATGTIGPFATTLPPSNLCASNDEPTDQEDVFDVARRYPDLTTKDRATVLGDGAQRFYIDLRAVAGAPNVVLFDGLATNKTAVSVAQLDLRVPAAERDDVGDLVHPALFLRVADGDVCTDIEAAIVPPPTDDEQEATLAALANSDVPLTLAPGESQCVGGSRAGQRCTQLTECGQGLACRRKPFGPRNIAFCYDGVAWDETRPCAFADADDECPFGECVGFVSGLDGGAFPFLYFYKASKCGAETADAAICGEPRVADWHAYPNERLSTEL